MTRSAFIVLLLCAVALAACVRPSAPPKPVVVAAPPPGLAFPDAKPGPPTKKDATRPPVNGPMGPVVPSNLLGDLRALGLDPAALPALEKLDRGLLLQVMRTFNTSLGVTCYDCHRGDDFHSDNPRKRVARHMWNDFVRGLTLEDGAPVYCDSCHQGTMYPLDRRDMGKVADYMEGVFVAKLKRRDGKDHECGTCHGDPPDLAFLDDWRRPDVVAVVAAPLNPPPKAASGPTATACGGRDNPCPLQKWMRRNMAPPLAAEDATALGEALELSAAFSPDPSWSWAEIAKNGAAAAAKGNIDQARKACRECHDTYKVQYKERYRTRGVK